MMRLTAYVSGRVQRVGFRARVLSLAKQMSLPGLIQNRPDGRVLVIAEGEREELERFASSIQIKNALIDVQDIIVEYSAASGEYFNFRKITGPDEVGERLDDGIEILKEIVVGVRDLAIGLKDLTNITKDGFDNLNQKTDQMLGKQDQMLEKQDRMLGKEDQMLGKQDQMLEREDRMLDKQDITIGEIRGLRNDLKSHMDIRFERIEADLAELKEMKTELKEKGII